MDRNLIVSAENEGAQGMSAGVHVGEAGPKMENQAWPGPALMLRAEELMLLAAVVVLYERMYAGHWGLFALLFLVPDVSFVGWIGGERRWAATGYNLLHWEAAALAMAMGGWLAGMAGVLQVGLIWLGHISFDRLVGYGLKYRGVFKRTHLQRV